MALLAALGFLAFISWFFLPSNQSKEFPAPTGGETIIKFGEEEGDNQAKREKWFELMHSHAPGNDWRAMEYINAIDRIEKRQNAVQQRGNGDLEILADGNLRGYWYERGSINQAGSVFDTEYDPDTDIIHTISAGGSLWKGNRDGSNWEVVNQDLRFNNGLLEVIDWNGEERMLAMISRIPHFSTDLGVTWTASTGITYDDSWGNFGSPLVHRQSNNVYVLAKKSYWVNAFLFKSTDGGETFYPIFQFDTHDMNRLDMEQPYGSDNIYLVYKKDNSTNFYLVNEDTEELDLLNSTSDFIFNNRRANLEGTTIDTFERWISYSNMDGDEGVFVSEDFGATWIKKGVMDASPWRVGIYISPSNPDALYMGEVECFRSMNGGANWQKVNNWYDYYGNEAYTLHADIMHFAEFNDADGNPFLLISNHGGMSISTNYLATNQNIGLLGLNVSQYYSVRSQPGSPYNVFAGSQDQGFQRAFSYGQDIFDFDQVISGDYGHIVFTGNGNNLWTVYPGGWVTYYSQAAFGGYDAAYDLDSENESVWIPPLMPHPDKSENTVYMAGGNVNGGPGSYIIELTAQGNTIQASQLPFDFKAASGGEVSAIASSAVNPDLWYAATTNGRFFYSTDGGLNWTINQAGLPSGHYLYGQAIYPSQFEEETVYLGGSGYSNSPVYKSVDGGQTFEPMNDGLPPTLVFGLVADPEEKMLFAGTESGPYVYLLEEEMWYDMTGESAPAQTYWSVEFIPEWNTVRFGTYGRGIWDFEIKEIVSTDQANAITSNNFEVFPNPSSGLVNINLNGEFEYASEIEVVLIDNLGKVLQRQVQPEVENLQLDFSKYPKGNYWLELNINNEKIGVKKLLLF